MKTKCEHCGENFETKNETKLCGRCEEYLHHLQWELNDLNSLYEYGEDGFCDGFARTYLILLFIFAVISMLSVFYGLIT